MKCIHFGGLIVSEDFGCFSAKMTLFELKTKEEVKEWLENNGISSEYSEKFEGKIMPHLILQEISICCLAWPSMIFCFSFL